MHTVQLQRGHGRVHRVTQAASTQTHVLQASYITTMLVQSTMHPARPGGRGIGSTGTASGSTRPSATAPPLALETPTPRSQRASGATGRAFSLVCASFPTTP